MKRYMLAALAGLTLISGCASDPARTADAGARGIDRSDPPLGSLIRRKAGTNGPEMSNQADIQALENARTMNNATIGNGH
jgi:hypothetical protein